MSWTEKEKQTFKSNPSALKFEKDVRWIRNSPYWLTNWEVGLINSITRRYKSGETPTQKQLSAFKNIKDKAVKKHNYAYAPMMEGGFYGFEP